jgi:putative transcriptional regulator
MTQAQLAARVSLATSTINDYEKGRCQPPLPKAIEIAQLFGKPVEEVFGYVEVPA